MTFSTGTPLTFEPVICVPPGLCVGAQISHEPGLTNAVAFIGSMHACSRKGTSYTPSTVLAPAPNALSASPSLRATCPVCVDAATYPWRMLALVTAATGPSSQRILSAFRPRCAVQNESATAATPL